MPPRPGSTGRPSCELEVERVFDVMDLPPALNPISPLFLNGHDYSGVLHVAVMADGARFATGTRDGRVHVFAANGDKDASFAIHTRGFRYFNSSAQSRVGGLAALGGDVLIAALTLGSEKGELVASWSASTGKNLEMNGVSEYYGTDVSGIAVLGPDRFVIATSDSTEAQNSESAVQGSHLYYLARIRDRYDKGPDPRTRVEHFFKNAHDKRITDLVAHENVLFTASKDKTAGVWNAITGERLQTLRGHTDGLTSVDASADWVVTASTDRSVRVYRNGGDFALFAALHGMHTDVVECVSILNNSVLMTGSRDETLCFTELAADAKIVARGQGSGAAVCAHVLNNARILVSDMDKASGIRGTLVFNAPLAVEESVRMHARALYSSECTVAVADPVSAPAGPHLDPSIGSRHSSGDGNDGHVEGERENTSGASDKLDATVASVTEDLSEELLALKDLASKTGDVSRISCRGQLARLLAAGMINFDKLFAAKLRILQNCVEKVLIEQELVGADIVRDFARDDILSIILRGLQQDDEYSRVTQGRKVYEHRLRSFLKSVEDRDVSERDS